MISILRVVIECLMSMGFKRGALPLGTPAPPVPFWPAFNKSRGNDEFPLLFQKYNAD